MSLERAALSFERHLRAENKSPSTVETYLRLGQLRRFLTEQGMPDTVRGVTREHVESFLVALQDAGAKAATVANRYRSLAGRTGARRGTGRIAWAAAGAPWRS